MFVSTYGGQQKTSLFPQRARAAARPKAAIPAKALTPTMEPADLEEVAAGAEELVDVRPADEAATLEELEVGVVTAAAEPDAVEDAPVSLAAAVADPRTAVNVTP
jgi:hypothetical protein